MDRSGAVHSGESEFRVGDKPLLDLPTKGNCYGKNSDNPDKAEYVVPVKWIKKFSKAEANREIPYVNSATQQLDFPKHSRIRIPASRLMSIMDLQRACHHPRTDRPARAQARRIRAHRQAYRPHAEFHRARHFFGDVERALLVQIVEDPSAHAPDQGAMGDPGAGRERRRHRYRRRACRRVQDGEPQPSKLYRALSGRRDRRRRYFARCVHHGGAADRLSQRAFLRRPEASENAASRFRRGRRHRRLRQFVRCADGRRRGALPSPL